MRKKLMSNVDSIMCIVLYFICYRVIFSFAIQAVCAFLMENFSLSMNFLYVVQFTAEMFMIILLCYLCRKLFIDVEYGIRFKTILSLPLYYIMMYAGNLVASIPIVFITESNMSNNQAVVNAMLEQNFIYTVFGVLVLAPIVEELIFRGVIYKNLRRKCGVILSIFISSLSFAVLHFNIAVVLSDIKELAFLPLYMIPSVFLCIIYEKNNNILAPISLHLVNNFIGIIAMIASMALT